MCISKSSHWPFHTKKKSRITLKKFSTKRISTFYHSEETLWSEALKIHIFTLVINRMQNFVPTKVTRSYATNSDVFSAQWENSKRKSIEKRKTRGILDLLLYNVYSVFRMWWIHTHAHISLLITGIMYAHLCGLFWQYLNFLKGNSIPCWLIYSHSRKFFCYAELLELSYQMEIGICISHPEGFMQNCIKIAVIICLLGMITDMRKCDGS